MIVSYEVEYYDYVEKDFTCDFNYDGCTGIGTTMPDPYIEGLYLEEEIVVSCDSCAFQRRLEV
jgi:hypothetical protein